MKIIVSVSCIIEQDQQLLLVREIQQGKEVYNQPSGSLEAGETLFAGAIREVREETGLEVELVNLLGIYEHFFVDTQSQVIRFCFIAKIVGGELGRFEDDEVVEARFYTQAELLTLEPKFRNPLVKRCMVDYRQNKSYPLATLSLITG